MIVKIWPVKGVQGAKQARNYVTDEEKVIQTTPEAQPLTQENISRVVRYMADEGKTKNYYISGYLCDSEDPLTSFSATWMAAGKMLRREADCKNENMCYHVIQSFPEGLDISDEEVHQCGIELLQKLEKYQGIVCSHVHPVTDEEGEVHGKSKHNHILFNAYLHPEKMDPLHPKQFKYHDCKETYEQLQIWNDEIAIDHGLPIIRHPDRDRVYSWAADADKQGGSKKERMRLDIEDARRASSCWSEFVSYLEMSGYQIREGAHVTYTAPDEKFKARDYKLGSTYKKENLDAYWALRDHIELDVANAVSDNAAPPLWILSQEHGPLSVSIPIGSGQHAAQTHHDFPLERSDIPYESLITYFEANDLYDLQDSDRHVVGAATGQEIITYLDDLRHGKDKQWQKLYLERKKQEEYEKEEELRRQARVKAERKKYYSNFVNTKTKKPYYIYEQDRTGRQRSTLEMIFLLAVIAIKNEDTLWRPYTAHLYDDGSPAFGTLDWKTQNMLDSIHLAAQEGLMTPEDIDDKLNQVGAEYSRARAALQKTIGAQGKMETLDSAIRAYEETRGLVERVLAMETGPEKDRLSAQFRKELDRYGEARAVMAGYKIKTLGQIDNFKARYADILANLPAMQEEFDRTKEEYRKFKKLKYHLDLAQDEQYCYGPAYDPSKLSPWEEPMTIEPKAPRNTTPDNDWER